MSDYMVVRRVLDGEKRRRAGFYRFRPHERAGAMAEIVAAQQSLERLRRAAEWKSVRKFWQDKY